MKQDRMQAIREEETTELDEFLNPSFTFMTREEREAEIAELNSNEELYSFMPPQNKDMVDIIKSCDISSLP